MGLFARIKPAFALTEFQNRTFLPVLELTLEELGPDGKQLERFERFLLVWRKILGDAGMHAHAICGDQVVKYFVFVPFEEGCKMLLWQLALLLVPNFQELPAAKRFEQMMEFILDSEKRDGGAEFDMQFRKCNPRSAESFEKSYGVAPFSPKLHQDPTSWMKRKTMEDYDE
jgi:hypothetical protein